MPFLVASITLAMSAKAAAAEAELSRVTIFVEGMMKSQSGVTWLSWPDSVVAALSGLAGIKFDDVEVLLDRDAFTISFDSDLVTIEDMYESITQLGFTPGREEISSSLTDSASPTGEIPEPISSGLAQANSQEKPLFVQFTAEWCIACRALEQTTFNDPSVIEALENYFILKVDTDVSVEASTYFEVVGMPTLLILDNEGLERERLVGQIGPEQLSDILESLLVE